MSDPTTSVPTPDEQPPAVEAAPVAPAVEPAPTAPAVEAAPPAPAVEAAPIAPVLNAGPRPAAPTPAMLRRPASAPTSAAPAPAPVAASTSIRHGRVDADGTVYLITPGGEEVRVGQWAAGPPEEGLAFFARKYDDLVIELELALARLADGRMSGSQAGAVLDKVREAVEQRSFVGDIAAIQTMIDTLGTQVEQAKVAAKEAREAAKAMAHEARERLAAEAESLRSSNAWKSTSERYAAIVEEWKSLPRGDRGLEQELWKRLSAARTEFDKRRRAHYAELDSVRKVANQRKKELIAAAESLAESTDWQGTVRKLRDLMGEWKVAPRGSRGDEDKLWKRFKAAQDAFFARKTEAEVQAEEALAPNVAPKEALVVEAEALLPISDPRAAKTALRGIVDRWDAVGDLPRKDRDRLEARLKKVEEAVRRADAETWKQQGSQVRERATNAFTEKLEKLEKQRDAAQSAGDAAKAADLESQIASLRALMGR